MGFLTGSNFGTGGFCCGNGCGHSTTLYAEHESKEIHFITSPVFISEINEISENGKNRIYCKKFRFSTYDTRVATEVNKHPEWVIDYADHCYVRKKSIRSMVLK